MSTPSVSAIDAHIKDSYPGHGPGDDRLNGYRKALKRYRHRIAKKRIITVESGDTRGEECGYDAMQKLLLQSPRPDAIFCYNDVVALSAERAVLDSGLSIPGDVALIGVSNLAGISFLSPHPVPLSSVDQNVVTIAAEAAEVLALREDSWKMPPRSTLVPPRIVIRVSTAASLPRQRA